MRNVNLFHSVNESQAAGAHEYWKNERHNHVPEKEKKRLYGITNESFL